MVLESSKKIVLMPHLKFFKTTLIAIAALMLVPSVASAGDFGLGGSIGTTGGSVEAKVAGSGNLMLRGSFNYLEFDRDDTYDDIDYDGEVDMKTFAGFVDLAPFSNGFVISGGAYLGDKTLDLLATPTTPVEIGDETFTPEEIGTLTGQAELANFAPYLGIGYDGFFNPRRDWSFNARAGVMFTGSPDVELISADGTLSSDARVQDALRDEIANIEDDVDEYKYYPVVTIGLTRRF